MPTASHVPAPARIPAPPTTTGWRAGLAAARLAWRAGSRVVVVMLALTAGGSILPVVAAWLGKALVDDLVHRDQANGNRVVVIAVAIVLAGAGGVLVGYLSGYASACLQRSISLYVEAEMYRTVNGFVGLRNFEDPAFQNRLRLADQAAQAAPTSPVVFAVAVCRGVCTVGGYLGVLLVRWPPMAVLILLMTPLAFGTQLVLARQQAATTELTTGLQRRRYFYRTLLTDPRAAKEVRIFGTGSLFQRRMLRALADATGAELRVGRRIAFVQSLLALLNAAVAAVGAAVVVVQAVHGRVSPGASCCSSAPSAACRERSRASPANWASSAGRCGCSGTTST